MAILDVGRIRLQDGVMTVWNGNAWVLLTTLVFKAYTTAGRPSAVTSGAGACYYDTTLSKPGWSNGAVWKDAAGTTI